MKSPTPQEKKYLVWDKEWKKRLEEDGLKYYGHKSLKVERIILRYV